MPQSQVHERRSDLLFLLEDDTMRLLDIQASNDVKMPYRAGIYSLMSGEKYKRPVHVTVLYLGDEPMRMSSRLECGSTTVEYELIDIREYGFDELMAGGPGDWALAILAKGGMGRLREAIDRAMTLPSPMRERLIAQMGMLSGLRKARDKFKMELKKMPVYIDIYKNVFLAEIKRIGAEQGRAEGLAEGRLEMLSRLLERRFGKLPRWAKLALKKGDPSQIDQWADRVLTAVTLEEAFGRK